MPIPLFNFLLYSLSFFINVEIFSTDRKRCVFFLYWERERFTEFSFSKIFFISFFLKENKSFLLQFVVKHYHDKAFVHCCSITKLALSISFIFTFCFFYSLVECVLSLSALSLKIQEQKSQNFVSETINEKYLIYNRNY